MFTVLERLLVTERIHQRASKGGGFSIPAMTERPVEPAAAPLLALNMNRTFLPTRPSRDGLGRFGFSHVPVGSDDALLTDLHRVLTDLAHKNGWVNRCGTVEDALRCMSGFGLEPHAVVVSPSRLTEAVPDLTPEQAREAMLSRGCVTEGSPFVYLADLPENTALVTASPTILGNYVRVGEALGVLLQRVNQAIVVVS